MPLPIETRRAMRDAARDRARELGLDPAALAPSGLELWQKICRETLVFMHPSWTSGEDVDRNIPTDVWVKAVQLWEPSEFVDGDSE